MLHGGDVYTDGLLKGRELLDYSSNINPLGLPQSFTEHISEGIKAVTRYPDIQYRDLLKNLTEYIKGQRNEDVDQVDWYPKAQNFVLGNGAAEVIDLAISCFKKILIIVPSFVEYELDAKKWGCQIEYSMLKEDMNYDYKDISLKLQNCDGVILGNPNNPNGGIIEHREFKAILKYCEENGKMVLVDEAFIEFTGRKEQSLLRFLEEYSCLFLIRAITKFFAMPGIRFGYGMSKNAAFLEKIREKQNPWNINCFAELAVKHVLKDEAYIKASLDWIEKERVIFLGEIEALSFVDKVHETNANYVLVKLKGIDCHKLYDLCLKEGLVIRKAHSFRGLDESFIRLAIKDRERNQKCIRILENINKTI